jgi:membrane fusion protein (multidrug efflux system)
LLKPFLFIILKTLYYHFKHTKSMKKHVILTIVCLFVLVGILGGIKGLQIFRMTATGKQFVPPPETVTTFEVNLESWESKLKSVGSIEAVQGVMITAELTGKVVNIAFEPGAMVKTGDLLVQQDISSETAQLRASEAAVTLAKLTLERIRKLLAEKTVSQSQYDNADAQYKQAAAQLENIRSAISKKTIRAPFAGRLGIRLINHGQILNEGDAIVSLQSLDPIFVNFSLPQQHLTQVRTGLTVRVTTDVLPDQMIEGKITAINPAVDAATRNIRVQATAANPQEQLRPGMFVNVAVLLPAREKVLPIPATAVLYAPYGDSVFVVEEKKSEKNSRPDKIVHQKFVRLGEKRGDFIAVSSGLKEGDTVVSTGVFKLRNGQAVVVNNSLAPEFKLMPKTKDS